MGQPAENEFMVRVVLDNQGEPSGLQYYDERGCGAVGKVLPLDSILATLLMQHDDHRINVHNQSRRRARCEHYIIEGVEDTRCTLKSGHEKLSSNSDVYSPKHKVEF